MKIVKRCLIKFIWKLCKLAHAELQYVFLPIRKQSRCSAMFVYVSVIMDPIDKISLRFGTLQIRTYARGFIVHIFEGDSGFTAMLPGELAVLVGYAATCVMKTIAGTPHTGPVMLGFSEPLMVRQLCI